MLSEFCAAEGISEKLTAEDRRLILHYFQRAYLQTAQAALNHSDNHAQFILEDAPTERPHKVIDATSSIEPLSEVVVSEMVGVPGSPTISFPFSVFERVSFQCDQLVRQIYASRSLFKPLKTRHILLSDANTAPLASAT